MNPIATMILSLILFAMMGAALACLAIPLILRRVNLLQGVANSQFHHSHKNETSRFGGLAIAGAFAALSLAAQLLYPFDEAQGQIARVIFCSALAMFLLGFWDDIVPLGAKKKLFGQVVIALCAWSGEIQIDRIKNPLSGHIYQLGGYGCGLTILWLIALPNLINLIDGIDGLAGGISVMLMGLLAYVGISSASFYPSLCAAGMVGAIIVFLRYNFPPSKIYMGDGGAYFLGFLVAELSIVNSDKGSIVAGLLAPLFVLALPILDVALAITRRGLRGLPIFRPDRSHIHHHLLGIGYSPRKAVLTLYFVTLVFLLFGVVVFWSNGRWTPVLFGTGCLVFILSARSFSFSREWFAVGRVLGNSMQMRESIHYALSLAQWFELEATHCDSVENLWSDFQLMLLKLNFVRANLILPGGRWEWKRNDATGSSALLAWRSHDSSIGEAFSVEMAIESGTLDPALFRHLSEIAAEAWQKSVASWCGRHGLPLSIKSRVKQNSPRNASQRGRAYVPLVWGPSASIDAPGLEMPQSGESLKQHSGPFQELFAFCNFANLVVLQKSAESKEQTTKA
jgi:UDP-GlcNAc:undecaprenyl-phosphate GlcNAc-1-phosphate transferase